MCQPDLAPHLALHFRGVEALEISTCEPLASHTTLRIGGPAEVFARCGSVDALTTVMAATRAEGLAFQILGLGSNVLVPDEGLAGIVAVLEGEFLTTVYDGERVDAGAGLPLARLARATLERGLVGLEALSGFPSTVGGAVVMNAGCYGVEIKDVLESFDLVWPDGRRERRPVDDLRAGYRSTALQGSGAVVTRAIFRLRSEDATVAMARLEELNRRRRRSMPSGRPNAGSIFKNPDGDSAGRLIEACGLKGRTIGDAEISSEHANVIVNRGAAKAADVLRLMVLARQAVANELGIELEPEVVLAGSLRRQWLESV